MKILFLSHKPHKVHLNFAKQINAKIKIIPFNKYVNLIKKFPILDHFYPVISLLYSLFIKTNYNIILIDGGSSLYTGAFLKLRNKKLKIIYLDADLLFHSLSKNNEKPKPSLKFAFKSINAVLSISEKNKNKINKFLKVPIEITAPYPKQLKQKNKKQIQRKNYGLYVGRLDPDKNIKRIISFGLQCSYFKKFIIIGEGTEKNYIKKITKTNKKIIYLEKRKNIEEYYRLCKFLIHIPDADPHPCTTMEATICGCFPIISQSIGTSYLFNKLFIIKNPTNFNEINNKIKFILENQKKAQNLLKKSLKQIPTKQQSLKNFKNKFEQIINIKINNDKKIFK